MAINANRSLTEQATVLFAGNSLALLFSAAIPIILVRLFSREDYGLYQQLFLIFSTLLPIGQMGVTQGLFYFLPREPDKKDAIVVQTFIFVVTAGVVFLLALILFRSDIAELLNNPLLEQCLPYLATFVFLMITSSFLETLMIAEGKTHLSSFVRVISELARSLAVVVTALATQSILAIFIALVVFSLARCLYLAIYLRKHYRFSPRRIDFSFWRRQLRYSIPMGLGNVAFLIQMKLHSFFVAFLFSPATFAIYTIGTYNLPFLGLITTSVSNVMVPELSKSQKDKNRLRILEVWGGAMRKMNLFFFPLFVFFFIMSHEFIVALFTEAYVESVTIFQISLFGLLVSGINNGAIISAYAETYYQLKIALLRLPIAIVVLIIFTKIWGVVGAVSASVVITIGFRLFVLGKVARVMEVSRKELLRLGESGRIMAAALLAGLPILIVKDYISSSPLLILAVVVPLYAIVYSILCLGFRVMGWSEILALFSVIMPSKRRS